MLLTIKNFLGVQQAPEHLMLQYKKSGNSKQLEALVQLFSDDLYHYLKTQSDHQMALDISQKTWLRVIEKRTFYTENGSFKAWLFVIARRMLIDEYRLTNRLVQLDEQHQQQFTFDVLDTTIQNRFELILTRLPFTQKEAFMLQQEGFSLFEIAQITGQEKETIKTRLRYARNTFKKYLGADNA